VYKARVHVLSMVILDPNSLGRNIEICLRPLIDKLKQLWSSRALTYDVSMKHNFLMRTALMWNINDFLAYRIVSCWSTHEKLTCSYCMENNKAFTLTNKGKTSFFLLPSVLLDNGSQVQKEKKMIFYLAELKRMLHPYIFSIKNCMMWC
jgi:hypothetical protein